MTIVVGGGQAGLAVSHALTQRAIEHVVLERARVAETWRRRWDSFTLVTPNWTMDLPGAPYTGDDPEGFVSRDTIVDYLQSYADRFSLPVREGVDVHRLGPDPVGDDRFLLQTSEGEMRSDVVVVCTGAFQRPHRPAVAAALPSSTFTIDAEDYTNPSALPDGRVVVVGSGQTGCQLAEELHEAGRDVILACGRAPWSPRRVDGVDIVTHLDRAGFFETTLASLPAPAARLVANVQATGKRGGHDLHYRTLQSDGVVLAGRLAGVDGSKLVFADDLAESVAFGDARYDDIRNFLTTQLPAQGFAAPDLPDAPPFAAASPPAVDLADVGAVVFTSGFRPDYASWIDFPIFDADGFPVAPDGAATAAPGLFFCGVHFLRTRRSGLLYGVGRDADVVAARIASRHEGLRA